MTESSVTIPFEHEMKITLRNALYGRTCVLYEVNLRFLKRENSINQTLTSFFYSEHRTKSYLGRGSSDAMTRRCVTQRFSILVAKL